LTDAALGIPSIKKEQSAFKSAADGVAIFSQKIKALLAAATKTMLIVVGSLVGITFVMFLIFSLVFQLLSLPGWIGFIIAVFIAVAVKYAFMDSFILTRTMVTYIGVVPTTEF